MWYYILGVFALSKMNSLFTVAEHLCTEGYSMYRWWYPLENRPQSQYLRVAEVTDGSTQCGNDPIYPTFDDDVTILVGTSTQHSNPEVDGYLFPQ